MGGSNGHSDELSCGEMYDLQTDEWTQVPELRTNRCNAGKQRTISVMCRLTRVMVFAISSLMWTCASRRLCPEQQALCRGRI